MIRKTKRYDWSEDDFTVSVSIDLPQNLKSVVSNAPKEDEAIGQYLKDLVTAGTITTDDVTFLIDSEALKN